MPDLLVLYYRLKHSELWQVPELLGCPDYFYLPCMYNNKNEITMDNGATTRNNDEKECVDIRKEGETIIVFALDDTDVGQV